MRGLLGPGDRKSVEPMAGRVAPGDHEQLHHFIASSVWDTAPLWDVLASKVNDLVGGATAHLIVDDTAIPKKGKHSVGVAHQYCGQLGKQANCQVLVTLTVARDEVPVPVSIRLYLPESWTEDAERRAKTCIPADVVFMPKWRIAIEEIERVIQAGVVFGDVLADAGYGTCSEFRNRLTQLNLRWVMGVLSNTLVYPKSVRVRPRAQPKRGGRPPKYGVVQSEPRTVQQHIERLGPRAFSTIVWRHGTKGPMKCQFAATRVCIADGPRSGANPPMPGQEVWLIAEKRTNDDVRYYLSNYPPETDPVTLAMIVKARWSCEQGHEQMKQELGLGHFEGRKWHGLNHHILMTAISFAFLQHLRLEESKKNLATA